jgi:hypothetical protein
MSAPTTEMPLLSNQMPEMVGIPPWFVKITGWKAWHGICCLGSVSAVIFINQGVSNEAFAAKRFYPDRIDDRGRDHRYFGCCGFAGLSGLHSAGEDI